jgi:hypothetical protein
MSRVQIIAMEGGGLSLSQAIAFEDLPFVKNVGPTEFHFDYWSVPPADSYEAACEIGRDWAARFIEFCKTDDDETDGYELSAILGRAFAKFPDRGDSAQAELDKGYTVGFVAFLQSVLRTVPINALELAARERNREIVKALGDPDSQEYLDAVVPLLPKLGQPLKMTGR